MKSSALSQISAKACAFKHYSLREMSERDLKWVYKARLHPSIKAVSGSQHDFSFKDHQIWFDVSTDVIKLVFTEDDKAKGVFVYDTSDCRWGFYLRPMAARRRGLGRIMLALMLSYLVQCGFKQVYAEIMNDNQASLKLHYQFGFFLSEGKGDRVVLRRAL